MNRDDGRSLSDYCDVAADLFLTIIFGPVMLIVGAIGWVAVQLGFRAKGEK